MGCAPNEVKMRISVIINPISGRRGESANMAGLEHLAAATGVEVGLTTFDGSERIETLVSRMVNETDMIGVAGGDGTLNGAINGVLMSDRPEIPILLFSQASCWSLVCIPHP